MRKIQQLDRSNCSALKSRNKPIIAAAHDENSSSWESRSSLDGVHGLRVDIIGNAADSSLAATASQPGRADRDAGVERRCREPICLPLCLEPPFPVARGHFPCNFVLYKSVSSIDYPQEETLLESVKRRNMTQAPSLMVAPGSFALMSGRPERTP
ncbi:hypothetical protein H112_07910 [Trichophyton rubrum D6]|uniref:Uncharacterized protein n=2 Tax=Trichophyton TaxID=5550 RepID=A0A022VQU8_TRIRU|nr:hypothetical protein H100_07937 [Trichophyton rubrum MR850]EZF37876.1 hypothetical protein H102_07897 [Trichophyton rubrum CBS 100081]EZF48440.1 hypothetical protein H103_07922 [Trichophyton rubrum CBS 288.86]EZF59136.1 hypothetical protein H104_07869 [Trichophyton rubrum CBS 289.86]EZF69693.1 hypothetical protein H105_07923 [Trichophyton soudanense CBS 452.61]EZF80399.1 hypothetical protein H110_07921 [Trichophyton rubrum MR1448]EZF91022.1 hypothetical protein H113_07984 [Trichophyton rub